MDFTEQCSKIFAAAAAFALGVLAFSTFAVAAPPAAAPAPPRAYVIQAAHLWDGHSDKLISPGRVVVVGGKISGVGATAPAPANAQTIDLGDATLLPGLIDAHVHLSGEASGDWKQDELDGFKLEVTEQTLRTVEWLKKTLMGGFTTVRDLGSNDFIDVGQRNAIAQGRVVGPRMLISIYAIGTTGGHCDRGGYRYALHGMHEAGVDEGIANGPDQMRLAVRTQVKHGADVIKTCATGGVLSLTDAVDSSQLTQAELDALVDEAHALGKKTAAHAHGAEGAKRAIKAGIDSIEHGSFLDDEALTMMKARGVYLVPTLSALRCILERLEHDSGVPPAVAAKAKKAAGKNADTFKRALAKGVKIALGTDAAVCPHGRNAEELGFMVGLGMKPADALRAATSNGAALLGRNDLGALEAGRLADVVAVPGDPLADVRTVEKVFFVMKEGAVYRNDRAR